MGIMLIPLEVTVLVAVEMGILLKVVVPGKFGSGEGEEFFTFSFSLIFLILLLSKLF